MAIDLDRELLQILDVEASSDRIQELALKAVQEATSDSLKEGLSKQANIGKVKMFMAQGMSAAEAIKKAYPGWSDEQVQALAARLGGQEKRAEAGTGAAIGSLLGGLTGVAGPLTGPLSAALGAHLGKNKEERKSRDLDKASPEARAAIGDLLGRLGGGFAGAATGAAVGGGTGALLPKTIQKKLRNLLAEKGLGKPSPRVAAILAGVGAGGAIGAGLGSVGGGMYGASRGAKGAFEKKKKGKEKEASVAYYGLKYASSSLYHEHMEKTANIFGQVGRGAKALKDAFFGGPPTGAMLGGLVGAVGGGGHRVQKLMAAQRAATGSRSADAAFRKLRGDDSWTQYHSLRGKASPSAAEEIKLKGFERDMKDIERMRTVQGGTGYAGLEGMDKLQRYASEFAPDVFKSMAGWGGAGAASGAAAHAAKRALMRKRVGEFGKSLAPLGVAAGGGALLGAALT